MGAIISRKRFGIWLAGVAAAYLLGLRPETANAQPCVSPNDCVGLNGPCSLGVCNQNQCQRLSINEGQSCPAPNICIIGATCNNGFCVGTYTPNCCTAPADCNDHNPCTIDSCQGNVCQHANAAPGTPCGSNVDDACTDPDTCNASGQCLTNDTPDGADCGGPDCLGGVCGEIKYRASLLPEGGNIGSEPRDGIRLPELVPAPSIIVGRVIDAGQVDHAAVWDKDETDVDLALLPEGGAGTSVANAVMCGPHGCSPLICGAQGCGSMVAVGSKGSPEQPAAWAFDGVNWTAEVVPLPQNATGGESRGIVVKEVLTGTFASVGSSTDAQGFRRAAYWERSAQGMWSVFVLPDFGVPGRESAASGIAVCPVGASPTLCVPGARLIAGFATDGPGVARPAVWRETGSGTGVFGMGVVPLPPGMILYGTAERDSALVALGEAERFAFVGTGVLTDDTTRGAVWQTTDFQSWTSTVLPPLPGSANALLYRRPETWRGGPNAYTGASYPSGGDPLLDGVATQWTLDPDTLALTSGPFDFNGAVSGLSASRRYTNAFWLDIPPGYQGEPPAAGTVFDPSAVAGTPQPHAAIAVAVGPAGIPAVSTWGMAVTGLLVLCAGTIVLRRAIRPEGA